MRDKTPQPPLVAAALALHQELETLEALVGKADKEPLTSQKSFERAARTLGSMTELEVTLREALARMVGALEEAGNRQHAAMAALAEKAKVLEARHTSYREVVARRDALADHGVKVNEVIRGLMAGGTGTFADALTEVARVSDESEAVFALAKERDFHDVAREVDSVRQQLSSLRRKLTVATGQPAPKDEPPG